MITAQEQPDAGTFKVGDSVKLAYVEQSRDSLEDDKTIWEVISGGEEMMALGRRTVNSRAYCAQFGFTGADQQKKVQRIQDDLRKTLAKTRAAIEVASIDLRRELEKSDADESRVGSQIDAIAKLEGTARKERIFAMLRMSKPRLR